MYLIKNISLINEGYIRVADVLIQNGKIDKISDRIESKEHTLIDGSGKWLLPGVIDCQVHFRDPGLTHKGDIHSESRAAVAGGTTSFIDMPNTSPNTLSLDLLAEKYRNAAYQSMANFGFLLGVNGQNIDEVAGMDTSKLLAITDDGLYFSGKGNLLADQPEMLARLFSECNAIIAIHAEKESIISRNEHYAKTLFGEDTPIRLHPIIRSREACFEASQQAIELALKHGGRLHILHLSTADECSLLRNDRALEKKQITAEVCVQHLWFSELDYRRLGAKIKWNPAIKSKSDGEALLQALKEDYIDIVTSDHAPHLVKEKKGGYFEALSGAPMVQHSLNIMLELHKRGAISLTKIVEKMCHNPAKLYGIKDRGYLKEGCFADMAIVDPESEWSVNKLNIFYKCGWSPLEGTRFSTRVTHTFVNGNLAYHDGNFDDRVRGMALAKRISRNNGKPPGAR